MDPGELEHNLDGEYKIDGQDGSQVRKNIRIQLKPKPSTDKNKKSSRLKKTIRIKRNQNTDANLSE